MTEQVSNSTQKPKSTYRMPNPHRCRTIESKQKEIKKNQGWKTSEVGLIFAGGTESLVGAGIMIESLGVGTLLGGAAMIIQGQTFMAEGFADHAKRQAKAEQLQKEIDNLRKN